MITTRHSLALITLIGLAGCGFGDGNFFGETTDKPLPGERIPIMLMDDGLKVDLALKDFAVILPRPYVNADWPQPGGSASKSLGHLDAADVLTEAWSVSIGDGGDDERVLLTQPVVIDGRVLTLDAEANLRAFNAETGGRLWERDLEPADEDEAVYAGGIAADGNRVFAITGYGEAMALALEDGRELWRVRLPGPVRGAPTVADGRVFAVTLGNRSIALSAEDGSRLWEHQGISEAASLLGGAAPAVDATTILVPYSSGEIFALGVETGRVNWLENLSSIRALDAISRLADIRGNPVIDNDLAFAVSHARRMVAIDLRTGGRVWERGIGGVHMPWVAGEFVFVVGLDGEVVALTRRDGRVRWVHRLPPFEDMEDKTGAIQYAGPVLVGDRLLVGSSDGFLYAISPYTGTLLGRLDIGSTIYVPPLVAGGTVYVLTDDGTLHAFR
ncbi:MAG: PQQ-binding-like beta-propeller repeat protein [Alphaproteobacteria bacterium]|nr:PQQ-binding-like beta-propeller repeat protein [Alphaproteobacteria bacterium]